jgi:predicted HTH transcriptional regulator
VIEQSKENYYLALRQTQNTIRTAHPNWKPWISFFLHAMQQQKRRLESKVDIEKLFTVSLPTVSAQILDEVRKHGRATIGDLIKATGISRSTLRDHLRSLVEKQHVIRYGTGKGSWYVLP